ncbi:MAG: rod shape-determining protein RodA [Paludibacteraceae bacterium]|nr:rod shape-determining protein RodA [Paludibacteraceae bacterium]MBP7219167.1 rod shape-determining protein RodA [Paludibacteraceae bacterium]MBP8627673.1 rod shape-determining protein RodA [Paludibacteraceae bacterium]MBP8781626.1 rod shape-determining protein RodA [Paludibacteraceae bacterium]MBP9648092.1 rod shape-determining protein RodA [Paludibacteraceae bacterium]
MSRKVSLFRSLDWITILLYVTLVTIGWFAIYSSTYDFENPTILNFSARHGSQLIWIGFAFLLALITILIDSKMYNNLAYIIYFLIILLLIATIFLAPEIKGSRSWLKIGPITMQPAELAKYATALCLGKFMSSYNFTLNSIKNMFLVGFIILTPMLIIILQQETGSALVFTAFFLVLFREGMNGIFMVLAFLGALFFVLFLRYDYISSSSNSYILESFGFVIVFILSVISVGIMIAYYLKDNRQMLQFIGGNAILYLLTGILHLFGIEAITYTITAYISISLSILYLFIMALLQKQKKYFLFIIFLIGSIALCNVTDYFFNNVLQPHQQMRIKVVLGLEDDPLGAGYNVRQSKIGIGSGGLLGKGFLNGTQTKLNYVPEQDTDFIFCTIGEEQGFVGSIVVLFLYIALIIRLVILAERQRSSFSRIFGYSVLSIIFFHVAINIGMVIGLVPVIGIPLVFLSYGGSSLWSFTILLFTFIRLDANRMEILHQ